MIFESFLVDGVIPFSFDGMDLLSHLGVVVSILKIYVYIG